MGQHVQADLHIVDAQPYSADKAFGLHAPQLRQSAVHHLMQHLLISAAVGECVAIMDVSDIQARKAQTLQTHLNTCANTGGRKIPALTKRKHLHIAMLISRSLGIRLQHAPHLARKHETIARDATQRATHALLTQPVAVVRRSVKHPAPTAHSGGHYSLGLLIAHGFKQIA